MAPKTATPKTLATHPAFEMPEIPLDFMIFVKIALFIFILSSPFYDVASVFSFLNNLVMKIVILILIVICSFLDLQLAIILTIAFFILLMSFNTKPLLQQQHVKPYIVTDITESNKPIQQQLNDQPVFYIPEKEQIKKQTDYIFDDIQREVVTQPEQFMAAPEVQQNIEENIQYEPQYEQENPQNHEEQPIIEEYTPTNDNVMQIMYEFPPVKCSAPRQANDTYMNDGIVNHYLDRKIKPYEEYISRLTNEELLEEASNGAFIKA